LEDELKQVRLQLIHQEHWIAELENKTVRRRSASGQQTQLGEKPLLPSARTKPIRPDRPVLGKRRLALLLRVAVPDQARRMPVNPDHRSLPGGCVGNGSGKPAPVAECTALASLGKNALMPSTEADREPTTDAGIGTAARNRKYAMLYAQKTPLNRAPQVAGVDPMSLLQFAIVIEMWKTRLIPVLIWIMQHLKN
jgi:hypothetical protein